MKNKINLIKCDHITDNIKEKIKTSMNDVEFEYKNVVEDVVIKPNLCYYWDSYTGYTTDVRVVEAIIDCVRDAFPDPVNISICESDATGMRTDLAFKILGYSDMAERKNVNLINLSKDKIIKETVLVNDKEIEFTVPKILLNSDLFINVPKLKIIRETSITCAMKNIFGCIAEPRKIKYHKYLHESIVGINKILKPDLTIVDGLHVLGKYPKKMNLIIAGTDTFSIDWIASQIMGYDPHKIKFLKLSIEEKLGDPKNIQKIGLNIDEVKENFPRLDLTSSKFSWDIQLRLLRMYSTIVGDITPPFLMDEL